MTPTRTIAPPIARSDLSDAPTSGLRTPPSAIEVRGARQHNLKNIDVSFPRGALTVITGVSGSGKSSLAFDTLYAEGQRRYVESVSTYAKQFLDRLPRPDVDSITGLTPAVAIQQVAPARSARSTVGTATEIYDFLRLLFARLGTVHCRHCGRGVRADSPSSIVQEAAGWADGEPIRLLAAVPLSERLAWAEQAEHLQHAGYTRIEIDAEVVPLDPLPKLKRGTKGVRVVIDRFTWHSSETERLADSCTQAFLRGEGRLEFVRGNARPEKRSERWECANCGEAAMPPQPALFSFNSPLGVCPECKGFGNVLTFMPELIVPDTTKSLKQDAVRPWAGSWKKVFKPRLEQLAKEQRIPLDVPWSELSAPHRDLVMEGGEGFRGAIPFLKRLQQKSYDVGNRFLIKRYQTALPCSVCLGTRLRPEALSVTLEGKSIAEVGAMTIAVAGAFIRGLEFTPSQRKVSGPVITEIDSRLRFLERVDLGYLTLNRLSRTLSGGESQRIELANALGANLADTLYVLDEPTVGLHPRDTSRLVEILGELAARGNTLVVVEHEPLVMRGAAHLVDLGPGAGAGGGHVLYAGPTGEALRTAGTATAHYLTGERSVRRARRPGEPAEFLTIEGASHHNLKDVTARFPLGRLTSVTGVSGSGKSSLIEDVLHRAAVLAIEGTQAEPPGTHRAIRGLERFKRIVMVDQSPIGRTPRSCPVTYMSGYAPLREIYARQPAAIARGLKDGAFSFNTPGGRCDRCEGAGSVTVEMFFLADLMVPCEVCNGDRFRPEVLEVRYRGLNIREALELTVDQAFEHFATEPRFTRTLHLLRRVGLGYLRLGQPATQLSGGESQRLKVARELSERSAGDTLVLLDEPTVGLHYSDVQRLLDVLDELVERGDTVIVIEHNMDVARLSDWIVDLGPNGGNEGGQLVAEGPPERIVAAKESWTGKFLAEVMAMAGPAEFAAAVPVSKAGRPAGAKRAVTTRAATTRGKVAAPKRARARRT